jgi:hypothetical protein
MTVAAIACSKALYRRQADKKGVPRQGVGPLSDHVSNDTDDRTYLIETLIRGTTNDPIRGDQKHHRHSPAHFRSETALEIR